jgi:Leucine-rich repeat
MTVSLEQSVKSFAEQIAENDHMTLDQVILDGIAIPELGDLTFLSNMEHLQLLSLNHCSITKLVDFPAGCKVQRLELESNDFPVSHLKCLSNLADLHELHLTGVKVEKVEDLAPLTGLTKLRYLFISDSPLSQKKDYLKEVFELLPELEVVDGLDKNGEQVQLPSDEESLDDSEEGDSEDDSEEDSEEDAEEDSDEGSDDGSEQDSEQDSEADSEPDTKKARK